MSSATLPRILVVDDHANYRNLLSMDLKKLGCQVDLANDAHEALELIKQEEYHVILMDLHMPGMDGISATQEIRSMKNANRLTTIVILTALKSSVIKAECFKVGANDFLVKPIPFQHLKSLVHESFFEKP